MSHIEMLGELVGLGVKVVAELDLNESEVIITVSHKGQLIQTDRIKFDEKFYPYFKLKVEKIYKYFKNK
jgi:hypothetical protein